MQEAFMALVWAVWGSLVGAVKNSVPTTVAFPKTWKGWAALACVLLGIMWFFDKIPDRKQIADVPRPVLTSEVSDLATKQEVDVNFRQMVMAFEKLQARVEALESKPKTKR
jgi:hypothetical protein